uniref:Uncharacterized protein n=1 Tax=Timema poppense TaxID=170557 RepID=A0A7R9DCX9_TIMPO|nr:unnamed protein product [Timema poppensis]
MVATRLIMPEGNHNLSLSVNGTIIAKMVSTRLIMPEGNHTEISDEDVVISGIAGSFPEAINTDELKEKLFNNAEFVKICENSNWGKVHMLFEAWRTRSSKFILCFVTRYKRKEHRLLSQGSSRQCCKQCVALHMMLWESRRLQHVVKRCDKMGKERSDQCLRKIERDIDKNILGHLVVQRSVIVSTDDH